MTPAEAALARLLEPPARPSPEQRRAVALAARGLSLFLRLPTGAGKSAAFQAPALLAAGATLVVAPLVALVEDQAAALRRRGVPVAQLTAADRRRDREPLEQRLRGRQLVYTTPEFLLQNAEMRAWLRGAAADARVARLVLDEAHCVFEWGHAFRPAYLELARWKARALPAVPVTLATASVSDADVHHLARVLGLRIVHGHEADETPDDAADAASRLVLVQQLADRPNLELEVLRKPADAAALVARRVGTAAAIVYCLTRKEAEDTSLQLARFGCSAGVYHGGLPRSRREFVRKQWMLGRLSVICATSAFGMGIDRPDVRFVVHHSIPMSLSAYMQQIGRAGRDGEPAECILLYDPNDKARALNLSIERQDAGGETVVSGGASMRDLNDVVAFCEMQPHECRREFLYSRFGMSFTKLECAERCNCNMPRNDVEVELEREVNNDIDRSSLRDARAGDDDGPSQSTIEYYYQRVRAEAKRNGLPKRESLSRQVIKAVLKAQPSSKDEMARLKGVGDSRAQLYFDLFRFDR